MKRALFENVKVIPNGVKVAVDRSGFLSAVLGITIESITGNPTASNLSVQLEHSDTETGEFKPVEDTLLGIDHEVIISGGKGTGKLKPISIEDTTTINIDLDLVGCKPFIKITVGVVFEGGSSPAADISSALVLGDSAFTPV